MKTSGQIICLWAVPVIGAIWLGCFLLFPGFTPPLSPTLSAEEVAAFYRDPENIARTRYSMILFNWFGVGLFPLYGVIVVQMKRMAHYSDVLAYGFLATITAGATLFATTILYFQLAVFRPDRDPVIIQLLNDMAWITFSTPICFMIAQCVVLALAIFIDRQPQRVFPLWVAYFNILIAIAVAPSAFASMTLEGPFAWDGLWSFWIRTGAITLWGAVMFLAALGAVRRQPKEDVPSALHHDAVRGAA